MFGVERNRYVSWGIGEIKKLMSGTYTKERELEIKALVNITNALMIPRGYISVCNGEVHVVTLKHDLRTNYTSFSIRHFADVIWSFEPLTGKWVVEKDRNATLRTPPVPVFHVW